MLSLSIRAMRCDMREQCEYKERGGGDGGGAVMRVSTIAESDPQQHGPPPSLLDVHADGAEKGGGAALPALLS